MILGISLLPSPCPYPLKLQSPGFSGKGVTMPQFENLRFKVVSNFSVIKAEFQCQVQYKCGFSTVQTVRSCQWLLNTLSFSTAISRQTESSSHCCKSSSLKDTLQLEQWKENIQETLWFLDSWIQTVLFCALSPWFIFNCTINAGIQRAALGKSKSLSTISVIFESFFPHHKLLCKADGHFVCF